MTKTKVNKSHKNNTLSIKLFFSVIILIVIYQVIGLMRGPQEWREYTAQFELFILDVSGDIDRRVIKESFEFGEVSFDFMMFARRNLQYAVSHAELPETISGKSVVHFAINSSKKMMQTESIKVYEDSLYKVPGQRVVIEAPDGSQLTQLMASYRGRLFRLMAVGEGVDGIRQVGDVEHFFRSFVFADTLLLE